MLTLLQLPGVYAVARLAPDAPAPSWAEGELVSVTRTADELSVVCLEASCPGDVVRESGFTCFRVAGTLAFELTGVLASLLDPLAEDGISAFAISTFDTDWILVREADGARAAWERAGHAVS